MKLSVLKRHSVLVLLILSLAACAFMPVAAAVIKAGNPPCHSVPGDQSLADTQTNTPWSLSGHMDSGTSAGIICNADAVLLSFDITQRPAIVWWLFITVAAVSFSVKSSSNPDWLERRRKRYRPTLRSHLVLGRIHV